MTSTHRRTTPRSSGSSHDQSRLNRHEWCVRETARLCIGLVGRAPSALKPASPPARARSRIYAMRFLACSSAPWLRPPRPRLVELIPRHTTDGAAYSKASGHDHRSWKAHPEPLEERDRDLAGHHQSQPAASGRARLVPVRGRYVPRLFAARPEGTEHRAQQPRRAASQRDFRWQRRVRVDGTAQLLKRQPPAYKVPAYVRKYSSTIKSYGWTPRSFSADYRIPIRVRATKFHGGD